MFLLNVCWLSADPTASYPTIYTYLLFSYPKFGIIRPWSRESPSVVVMLADLQLTLQRMRVWGPAFTATPIILTMHAGSCEFLNNSLEMPEQDTSRLHVYFSISFTWSPERSRLKSTEARTSPLPSLQNTFWCHFKLPYKGLSHNISGLCVMLCKSVGAFGWVGGGRRGLESSWGSQYCHFCLVINMRSSSLILL
jgi:hypothetical protein